MQEDVHISKNIITILDWHQFGMSTIGCGPGFHTGMTGIISSPNYPDNPVISTEPGSRCTWIIKVQDNENILVTMVDLDLSSKLP